MWRIVHPVAGKMAICYEVLAVQSSSGLTITSYLPEPGSSSADALELLRSRNAGAEHAAVAD
nr:hypothetical protein [Glutamicibacter halophytocola]